jgi:hypothetical protein
MVLASTLHGRGDKEQSPQGSALQRRRVRGLGSLTVMVSAPVEYSARDFVLHLFDRLCRKYLEYEGAPITAPTKRRLLTAMRTLVRLVSLVPGAVLITAGCFLVGYRDEVADAILTWLYAQTYASDLTQWRAPLTRWLPLSLGLFGGYLVLKVCLSWWRRIHVRWQGSRHAPRPPELVEVARDHLERIRLLQTYTTGWSGSVKSPVGVEAAVNGSLSSAQQPLTYPEIVTSFRDFLYEVADEVRQDGNAVFIGIDELDKIESSHKARQFVNDVKGVFDVPNVYFLASVSEDALISFERRGVSVRDAFDSAFDEIIRADYLDLSTAKQVLERRVVGLSAPYIAFCHALSGGLPRDLIRVARRVVAAADTTNRHDLAGIVRHVLWTEFREQLLATRALLPRIRGDEELERLVADFDGVLLESHDVDRVLRASTALSRAVLAHDLSPSSAEIPDHVKALALLEEISAYGYFCATLLDVFGQQISTGRIKAATDDPGSGSFAALAQARQSFAVNPQVAALSIDRFRQAWGLGGGSHTTITVIPSAETNQPLP